MPLFTVELNDLADRIGRSDVTARLHTAVPTNGSPTNGRTTVGGGAYEAGVTVTAARFTAAAAGDTQINADIDFGTADQAVGTVGWLSFYRGADPVLWVTVPSTTIGDGDSFSVNMNTLNINGSTT